MNHTNPTFQDIPINCTLIYKVMEAYNEVSDLCPMPTQAYKGFEESCNLFLTGY